MRAAGLAAETEPARACRHAEAALALSKRVQSTSLQPGELWLACGRALIANGQSTQSRGVLLEGRDWLHRVAREYVPPPFRDSFLGRHPVGRELLRLAMQASA